MAWKCAASPRVTEVLVAPGNAGTATEPRMRNVAVAADDVAGLVALAASERVDLTIIGPEAPLDAGLVDHFRAEGLAAFGPTRGAARIETSKAWAKRLMLKAGIPTASARTFTEVADAKAEARRLGTPVVVKATGLAAGKGVVVAQTIAEADEAIADGPAIMQYLRDTVAEEGIGTVESVVFAKYLMFRYVYWHHTARIASAMFNTAVADCLNALGVTALSVHHPLLARLALATQMAGDRSLQRGFFTVTRVIAFDLYYADPATWAGIPGYRGPPQPEGYPDHADPPG